MTEPIARIGRLVQLLASPPRVQLEVLANSPHNPTDYCRDGQNDIRRLVALYEISWSPVDDDGGAESRSSWLRRSQMPEELLNNAKHPALDVLPHLSTAIRMIGELDRPFFFTKHGLRSAHEWKLIRHLAAEVCDAAGWPLPVEIDSFSDFYHALSGEQLDSPIE